MTQKIPTREEKIFYQALEKSPDQREACLKEACGDDQKLYNRVEALLQANDLKDDFLDSPVLDSQLTLENPPNIENAGTIIDRYKLLERIGEGGMATVYMAEQKQPIRRRVALKIIKLGMDTKSVIARFEAERQALAIMDHPNIAHVFDAGATESGRPYFVMELVKGASITEFCDANNLSTQERLELFVQVCQAVQHAHQKGIIHRDIKPTNVMVTLHDGVPVPKVIDFGIAKAVDRRLTEKTLFTRYAQIIGTPAYMSPEQAELSGLDIDIRTDVFSLGTLLYELLTGSPPFTSEYLLSKSYEEMQRIIREEEPTRPSTKISTLGQARIDVAKYRNTSPEALEKLIRADLDWIVMKTLEKDRNRRYDSVSEFAADIKRYLHNEPVLAGPPSTLYRVKKYIQRRRGIVTASVAVITALLIGLVVSTVMYYRAEHLRQKESAARAEARTITDFFTNDLLASVFPERIKSREVTVKYLLDMASKNLENKFANSPLAEAEIRQTLGFTYQKLGDYKAAESHLQRSLELYKNQVGEENSSTLTALNNLGWNYCCWGRYQEAEPLLLSALESRTRILSEEDPNTLESMANLGWAYMCQAQFDEGMQLTAKVLEIGTRVLGEEHPTVLKSMYTLAHGYMAIKRFDEAEALSTKGLALSRRVLGEEHESTLYLMNALVWSYEYQSRHDICQPLAIEALQTSQRIFGNEHPVTIQAMSNLGILYLGQKRYEEAAPLLTKSVELANQVLGETQASTIFFTFRLYQLYCVTDQHQEADALLMKLLPISRQVQGEDHPQYGYIRTALRTRAEQLGLLANKQYDANDYQEALATYTYVEPIHRAFYGESIPSDIEFIAMSLYHLGRDDEARAALDQLRAMYEHGEHIHEEDHLYKVEKFLARDEIQISQAWDFIQSGELEKASEIVRTLYVFSNHIDSATIESMESLSKALVRAYCIRGRRAQFAGDYDNAISDYETAVAIQPAYAPPLQRLTWLQATCPAQEIRNGTKAIKLATKACELTEWKNSECIDILAAAYAEIGDYKTAVKWQQTAIDLLPEKAHKGIQADYAGRLALYKSSKPFRMKNSGSIVAWWTLDEIVDGKIIDSSGISLDGKLVGDAKIVTDAERGNVLSLAGNGYVDCGTNAAFDITGPITVSVWIKVNTFNKYHQAIITKGDTAWRLQRFIKGSNLHFGCPGLRLPNNDPTTLTGMRNVDDGAWHYIAGIFDGMKMFLYIDGDLDVSADVCGLLNINDEPVYIGANSVRTPGREWNGLIDDVRIYNYGLSEAQVKALYASKHSKIEGK